MMSDVIRRAKEQVVSFLNQYDIPYEMIEHEPIYTISQLYDIASFPDKDKVAKNLFLRNDGGNQHYLVIVRSDKSVDLKDLRRQIGASRLGFASEERLMTHLKLEKGSVTPLGIINDETKKIPVLIDRDLMSETKIGVHPNTNSATIWLSYEHLVKAVECHGNPVFHVVV